MFCLKMFSLKPLALVRISHNPPDDVAHAPTRAALAPAVSRLFSTLRRAVTQRSESERRQEWRRGTQSACATSSPKKSGEICGLVRISHTWLGRVAHAPVRAALAPAVSRLISTPLRDAASEPCVGTSGTGPERPLSGPETGGDPAARGSVVPIGFLESGTGPERPLSGPETGGDPAATGSVVPIGFLESAGATRTGARAMSSRASLGERCGLAGLLMTALLMTGLVEAQPALTTIQDILYSANGTRFNGTMYITWSAFQAGDTSNIATSNIILPIVNGVLKVMLVPTTTASGGAQYNVTYNQNGVNQFTQVWAVPPSSVPLRVSAVLVSSGTVIGPAPITSPVQISDVVGLTNALALGVQIGVGFTLGRTAIINDEGQIDGATGTLSDCMHVDGTSGPCGSSGGIYPGFSDAEIPSGSINGSNAAFTLAFTPSPAGSLELYLNGLRQDAGVDFTLSGNTVTFLTASTPQSGDLLLASYRYANPTNPLGSLTTPQVVCSTTGASTFSATLTQLGSCTLPAGLLGNGDRLEIEYQYNHTGSTAGFTGQVEVGGTVVVINRTGASTESLFDGHTSFGLFSGGQSWDTQSWGGSTLAFATAAGTSAINTALATTISFQGLTSSTADTLALRNFTVIRYPAQTNP